MAFAAPSERTLQEATPAQTTPDIPKIKAAAEAGDADAQFQLGKAYQRGNGVPHDDARAVQWLRKAADQGNPSAENNLGTMYSMGLGIEKSKEEAISWYQKAAKSGDANAMFNLGASFYNGDGVAENAVMAYAWFLLAQEAGSAAAQDAVRRSDSEMSEMYKIEALLRIGEMYAKGDAVPQNFVAAAKWYRKASDRSPEGAIRLATILINGKAGGPDYSQAMDLCTKAAKVNYAGGFYCVGYLYERGLGVTADSKQAVKWYTQAANHGHAKAALTLSQMYLDGNGVEASRPEAFVFLYLAYKGGAMEAKAKAHTLRPELSKDESKKLNHLLQDRRLDPNKVFALIDDPTIETRQVLPPVAR